MNFSQLELKIPPVLVVIISVGMVWATATLLPEMSLSFPGRVPAAISAALAGIAVSLAGVAEFRRARTTVNPLKPEAASSMVARGIYRHTRNPMYLGFALVLLGWGIFMANPLAMAVLLAFVAYMTRFQIAPEERALEARFGEAFKTYRAKVRRWL